MYVKPIHQQVARFASLVAAKNVSLIRPIHHNFATFDCENESHKRY
jgi:hypothetical protein